MPPIPRIFLIALFLGAASCASEDVHFDVRSAPEFGHGSASLSVFGVFKNGRMSPEAWDELAPRLSPALGAKSCDAAYGKEFVDNKPALATTIENTASADGVTDPLLDAFSPLAKGDAIMTIAMTGENPTVADGGNEPPPPASPPPMRGGGGRGGRRGGMGSAPAGRPHAAAKMPFEMSASVFSVKLHRSIARVTMTYSGSHLDEAVDKFRLELQKVMPGASCAGWNWDVDIDEARIPRSTDR